METDPLKELRDSGIEDYKQVLRYARSYYDIQEFLGVEPQGGLQKAVYDLGKGVRGCGFKNRRRNMRKLMAGLENVERLSEQGFF